MAAKALPSPEVLRQFLRYDDETGILYWRERGADGMVACFRYSAERMARTWNSRHAGRPAGHVNRQGYVKVLLQGQIHSAHRIVLAMKHGAWPEGEVDHINGDKADNRISNLRVVTHQQNARNRPLRRDNMSGVSGVGLFRGKWRASIKGDSNEPIFLGEFDTLEDAAEARRSAESALGYHPNHGRSSAKARHPDDAEN